MSAAQQRLAELRAGIAKQMGTTRRTRFAPSEDENYRLRLGQLVPAAMEERPVHVTIDREGRTIDSLTGEVLQLPGRVPTLKANMRVQKKDIKLEQPKIKAAKEAPPEFPGLDASAQFHDGRLL